MGQSLSRNGESVHIILLPFIASLLGYGVHELEVRISSRDSVTVVNSRVTQKGWPGARGGQCYEEQRRIWYLLCLTL